MRLAVNKMSALSILRSIRSARGRLGARCELPVPDPSPRRRLSAATLPLRALALETPPDRRRPLHVAVPSRDARVQASFVACTVYSAGLPPRAFVEVADGVVIPCPELLFLELAPLMMSAVHALLGYELCGSYARDPADPRTGPVAFDVPPVTTVERIARFLDACHGVRGLEAARRNLDYIANNAWSPMESIASALAVMPVEELGYRLGPVRLNVRHENPDELVALGCRSSRVPDIEVDGSSIGFNYDGREHFDPDTLVSEPDDLERARAARKIRERYVDDLRRNRELAALGRVVLPVTSEDLFQEGGLDAVMLEAAAAMKALDGLALPHVHAAVRSRTLRRARQRLVWSLLPWDAAAGWAREIAERERPKAMRVIDVDLTM